MAKACFNAVIAGDVIFYAMPRLCMGKYKAMAVFSGQVFPNLVVVATDIKPDALVIGSNVAVNFRITTFYF
jgi:hypothetical protein